jgi:hypothetical protein
MKYDRIVIWSYILWYSLKLSLKMNEVLHGRIQKLKIALDSRLLWFSSNFMVLILFGFEPRTLHILCIVSTNWVKLMILIFNLYCKCSNDNKIVQVCVFIQEYSCGLLGWWNRVTYIFLYVICLMRQYNSINSQGGLELKGKINNLVMLCMLENAYIFSSFVNLK